MKWLLPIMSVLILLVMPANSYALSQFNQLQLNSAPPKTPARIALIDTTIDSQGSMLGNRIVVRYGNGNGTPTSHGSMMATAITGGWTSDGQTNTGSAVGATVDFYGCDLHDGIDILCSITALEWAVQTNVRVINLSFASDVHIPAQFENRYLQAFSVAEARGIVIVASAGEGTTLPFPARLPNVISVSSINYQNKSLNPTAYTSAPGRDLVVYSASGLEFVGNGSSYATAYASGVIARLISLQPKLTPAQIRSLVKGRVNMARALRMLNIKSYRVPAPRCVRLKAADKPYYVLTWNTVPAVKVYRVQIGQKLYFRESNIMRVRVQKGQRVSVRSIGQYSQLSVPRFANSCPRR